MPGRTPKSNYSSPLNFPLSSLVKTDLVVQSRAGTICHYSSPLNFPLSSLVKTDHEVRSRGHYLSVKCPRATIRR